MKNKHRSYDEYGSSPPPKKKKAPWFLIICILLVSTALAFCLLQLNGMVNDAINNRTQRESFSRKDTKPTAPVLEAPPVDAPAAEAPAVPISVDAADAITLWTYPIGRWGDAGTVEALTAQFEAETGIKVTVEYLTYVDGDDKVITAIEAGAAPDLILESPDRLVAAWGARGNMVDISDMFDDTDRKEISPSALDACFANDGSAYMYPLAMTVHSMAINKRVFEDAGAMQFIDQESHTWTTEEFLIAMELVYECTGRPVGTVFCGSQGGDPGTRALVTNLFGGSFTNDDHTLYTWDDPANLQALELLRAMEGILPFDDTIAGGDEIAMFYHGDLNIAFCWNVFQQITPNSVGTEVGRTASGDEILFMAFPSPNGTDTRLFGNVWGFGIFDNGDPARIEAARMFIRYMCDSPATVDAVIAANYFPVRERAEGADLSRIWAHDPTMSEYQKLLPLMGDCYSVTPGWSNARVQWRDMLQAVGRCDGSSGRISAIVDQYVSLANH